MVFEMTIDIFKELFIFGNRFRFPGFILRIFDLLSGDGEHDREYQR